MSKPTATQRRARWKLARLAKHRPGQPISAINWEWSRPAGLALLRAAADGVPVEYADTVVLNGCPIFRRRDDLKFSRPPAMYRLAGGGQ